MALFNKGRFKLLKGNRIQKYLGYAIGEVILVVVGILIALSINTNQQEKTNDKELERIITIIKSDLNKDFKQTKMIIDTSKTVIKLTLKVLLDDKFNDSIRGCVDCRYLMNETIPFNAERNGYNLLSSFNKDVRSKSPITDSIVNFYNVYKSEDFDLLSNLALNELLDNFKYMRDNFDWFSEFQLGGNCNDDCLDYFESQEYINRLTYYDLIAHDNYLQSLVIYHNELEGMINYLNKISEE